MKIFFRWVVILVALERTGESSITKLAKRTSTDYVFVTKVVNEYLIPRGDVIAEKRGRTKYLTLSKRAEKFAKAIIEYDQEILKQIKYLNGDQYV